MVVGKSIYSEHILPSQMPSNARFLGSDGHGNSLYIERTFETVPVGALRFRARVNTLDRYVLTEVISSDEYGVSLSPGDVVFDIGAHIGAFSVQAAKKAKQVIAFEAEQGNYALLLENLSLNNCKNVEAFNAAVVGNDDKERSLYVNVHRNTGSCSFFVKRNYYQTVQCTNIVGLLSKYKP